MEICPINHDYGVCEICDRIRDEDIPEGTFRDGDVKDSIRFENIETFHQFVENALSSKKHILRINETILLDIYLSYRTIFVARARLNKCLVYLIDRGLPVDACGKDRWTILRYAQCYENMELCSFLIKKGANVNSIDYAGVSILHAAAVFEKNAEIVLLLLCNGADPNLYYEPILSFNPSGGGPILHLLIEMYSNGLERDAWKIIQYLLEYGADPDGTNYENKTAMDCMNSLEDKIIFSKMIEDYYLKGYPKEPG